MTPQSDVELTGEQIKAIAKIRDERKPYSFRLLSSGGDCGCVHLIDSVHFAGWRIDREGRVQGR